LVLAQVQNARRYRASVPTSACFSTPSKHAPSPRNGEGHRGGPLELCGPPLARAPRSL